MARYSVVLGKLGESYRVEIVGDDGARQTILGFEDEAEAHAWIEMDKRQERHRRLSRMLEAAD